MMMLNHSVAGGATTRHASTAVMLPPVDSSAHSTVRWSSCASTPMASAATSVPLGFGRLPAATDTGATGATSGQIQQVCQCQCILQLSLPHDSTAFASASIWNDIWQRLDTPATSGPRLPVAKRRGASTRRGGYGT